MAILQRERGGHPSYEFAAEAAVSQGRATRATAPPDSNQKGDEQTRPRGAINAPDPPNPLQSAAKVISVVSVTSIVAGLLTLFALCVYVFAAVLLA